MYKPASNRTSLLVTRRYKFLPCFGYGPFRTPFNKQCKQRGLARGTHASSQMLEAKSSSADMPEPKVGGNLGNVLASEADKTPLNSPSP